MQWPDVSQTIAELREYKAANQFAKDLSWLTKPLAEPPVTFNIRPLADFLGSADDHDKKKSSAQLATLIRYETLSLDAGVPIGFILTGPLPTEAEIESLRAKKGGVFDVPTGYQARYLLSANRRNGLIYLRNYPSAASNGAKYREPVSRPFTLTTTLPKGKYRFEILDLDKQTSEKIVVQSPGVVLQQDRTASDFAVKFQRID